MAKEKRVLVQIDEATTLVLEDGSSHSGVVTVNSDIAKQLTDTGRALEIVNTTEELKDGTAGNE